MGHHSLQNVRLQLVHLNFVLSIYYCERLPEMESDTIQTLWNHFQDLRKFSFQTLISLLFLSLLFAVSTRKVYGSLSDRISESVKWKYWYLMHRLILKFGINLKFLVNIRSCCHYFNHNSIMSLYLVPPLAPMWAFMFKLTKMKQS